MTSSTALKPLLDFASGNPSADDLDKMALVVGFMREPVPVTGRAAGLIDTSPKPRSNRSCIVQKT